MFGFVYNSMGTFSYSAKYPVIFHHLCDQANALLHKPLLNAAIVYIMDMRFSSLALTHIHSGHEDDAVEAVLDEILLIRSQ